MGPALIRRGDVTRHVWGDPDSGEVFDWIYDLIHMLVFGVAPGGAFRHSEAYRTVFAADEVLHVLEGTLVIADPQTGEVERVATGESVFFRRDTWHHACARRSTTRTRASFRCSRPRWAPTPRSSEPRSRPLPRGPCGARLAGWAT